MSRHVLSAITPGWALCLMALVLAGVRPSQAATQTVTNTNDSGAGSLRAAIAGASSGDTIVFASTVTGTITLTSGPLFINQNLNITGPGASQLAVSGNNSSQVFTILGTVSISGLTVEKGSNVVGVGGGIFNQGELTLTTITLSGNSATGGNGGGISNANTVTLINSTVSGNSASQGGGIYNAGDLTIIDSTVSGNSASGLGGGGVFSQNTLTITNSTISNNSATGGNGGGLYISDGAPLSITNSTVSGNSASAGGGLSTTYGSTSPLIKSTLLANNGAGGNCGFFQSTATSQGYNLSDDDSCASAFTQTGDQNNVAAGAGLSPAGLQNNGGPTRTIALLPTSPAVDAVPVADCTDTNNNPIETDQRGVSRPQGKGCDVGAYELVQSVPFASFHAALTIATARKPGFLLTSTFTLGSASTGLNPATEAMTLQIASYTLTLPPGLFHQLWKAPNAPYVYEGTVNGATVLLGVTPLCNNTFAFDAAGSPVTFPGIKNPVTVTLTFGDDSGTSSVTALITKW